MTFCVTKIEYSNNQPRYQEQSEVYNVFLHGVASRWKNHLELVKISAICSIAYSNGKRYR